MNRTSVTSGGLRSLTAYLAVGLACVPILTAILQLWKADWRVPFSYVGDSMFYSMLIKSICDNGWFLHNGFLGMPWGTDLHDFPLPDIWHWFFIKLAALLTSDHALILNLAFLATFPLAALAALWVFRQFQVAWPPAMLGSLLYAFLPYHFYRGEPHLFLGAYYTVPLMVLVLLWVCAAGGETGENDPNALRLSLRNRKFVLSVGICILMAVSSTAVYYPAGTVGARRLDGHHLRHALVQPVAQLRLLA
jgi:phosphoglycerol transferase